MSIFCDKGDCFANMSKQTGRYCSILKDTDFGERACPFFKTKEQLADERMFRKEKEDFEQWLKEEEQNEERSDYEIKCAETAEVNCYSCKYHKNTCTLGKTQEQCSDVNGYLYWDGLEDYK